MWSALQPRTELDWLEVLSKAGKADEQMLEPKRLRLQTVYGGHDILYYSSVGQGARPMTVRSAVQARVGPLQF